MNRAGRQCKRALRAAAAVQSFHSATDFAFRELATRIATAGNCSPQFVRQLELPRRSFDTLLPAIDSDLGRFSVSDDFKITARPFARPRPNPCFRRGAPRFPLPIVLPASSMSGLSLSHDSSTWYRTIDVSSWERGANTLVLRFRFRKFWSTAESKDGDSPARQESGRGRRCAYKN
jgi:hypothetical protein